jgi:hypothetical protein
MPHIRTGLTILDMNEARAIPQARPADSGARIDADLVTEESASVVMGYPMRYRRTGDEARHR